MHKRIKYPISGNYILVLGTCWKC